ncbi:hypothetical protein KL905_004069 [Ogataea polymorpha]|uniref:Uncharacterized protein n=2 Tax=Ogataea polymorpha TaxID=460523 RepID=A0A9P8SZ64_9ASCO|nr:hypothetical protein KL937_003831 [Ogataea polymorpha]KAG7890533.1 hypothetical protein KL908_004370 [Ogataea polymorpha]KAG7898900.1 hypothetical protein KL935_003908 [Ogataea polymorpha]KAG7903793.1 hypothetical protein KL907_003820 [Ogataea polymorpha]KAG7907406.1 hypothetical protein KL906_004093 [Ogataea polymorpha]
MFSRLLLRPSPITNKFVFKAVPRTRLISNLLARPMARPLAPKLGVSIGVLSISSYWLYHNQIKNEVAFGDEKRLELESAAQDIAQKPQYDKSLGGKLDYQELSIGSMCGLVCGMVVGKLSSIFVFLSLSFYLGVQFLNSRGIVSIPWTRYIKMGSHLIDVRQMIFEKPSFNITFILTFLLAAYYI